MCIQDTQNDASVLGDSWAQEDSQTMSQIVKSLIRRFSSFRDETWNIFWSAYKEVSVFVDSSPPFGQKQWWHKRLRL